MVAIDLGCGSQGGARMSVTKAVQKRVHGSVDQAERCDPSYLRGNKLWRRCHHSVEAGQDKKIYSMDETGNWRNKWRGGGDLGRCYLVRVGA